MATISVIIATYNRAALLDECLAHLARQRYCHGDEVIVVDNGSTDATGDVLRRHAAAYPVPLRIMEERRPGKSHALTTALARAGGDIFAFTDDDVNVTPEWLSALRNVLDDGSIALAGGPVAPRWEKHAPDWLRSGTAAYTRFNAPLALLDYGPVPCPLGERTLLGANMAIQRRVMEAIGGFATHLGKLRGTLLSGEDHDLCQRVQAAGHSALYVPSALVHHWVPYGRMRLRYFLAWFYWSGITNATLDADHKKSERTLLGLPTYLERRFVVSLGAAALATISGRFSRAVDQALDVAFAVGYACGRWRLVTVPIGNAHAAR